MTCPYETARRINKTAAGKEWTSIQCGRMFEALGWTVAGPLSICNACQDAKAHLLPAEDTEFGRARIATLIRARLEHGDMPEWQTANPIDVDALFARYAAMVSREQLEACYDSITLRWIATPETITNKQGQTHPYGHPEAVAGAKLRKIANDNGLEARYGENEWLTRPIAAGLLADRKKGGCRGCGGASP